MARIAPDTVPATQPLLALGASVIWAALLPVLGWLDVDGWILLHSLILGVFGNAAVGAALQFGSAVLGFPRLFPTVGWAAVLAVFNVGVLMMLMGPVFGWPEMRVIGSPWVVAALWALITPLIIGLARSSGPSAVRFPLAVGFLGLGLAALLGAFRLWGEELPGGLAAHRGMGIALGLGGVVLGASRLLLPTLTGVIWRNVLRLEWPFRRRPELGLAWLLGGAMALMALLMQVTLRPGADEMLPPMVIAGAIALVVPATALPITAFLHWWRLRQRVPRGRQVPGIDRLLPSPVIGAWLALRVVALAIWGLAIGQSDVQSLRQGALVAESLAATALLIAFLLPAWRARRFRLTVPSTELT